MGPTFGLFRDAGHSTTVLNRSPERFYAWRSCANRADHFQRDLTYDLLYTIMKREEIWLMLRPDGRRERTVNMIGVVILLIIGLIVGVAADDPLGGAGGGQRSSGWEAPLRATGTDRQPTMHRHRTHTEAVANQQTTWYEPAANPVRPCSQRGA